jgi:tellurite resistance protein
MNFVGAGHLFKRRVTMADDNAMARRGKALEEEYFHRKEKELLEKLKKRRTTEGHFKDLSEATGTASEEVLQSLHELGYTRDTVALLHLVPLVNVAWADGKVSGPEHRMILEAARLRGVEESSPAYDQLEDWLQNRPDADLFDQTLRVIGHLAEEGRESDDTLTQALAVASASGGILGLGNKVSSEEQALLERIAAALSRDA